MKLFRSRRRTDAAHERRTSAILAEATALYQAGRYPEAEAEALAVASTRSWPPSPDAHLARGLATQAVSAQGRRTEALRAYDELLLVFRGVFGVEHPRTLILRINRAQTLAALARYGECETECASVVRVTERASVVRVTALGEGPELMPAIRAAARSGLIHALNGQGRHKEAEALAREALGVQPGTELLALALRVGLARSLTGLGRHAEALAEAQRAAVLRATLSEETQHPEAGAVETATALALLGLGRNEEARARAAAAHDACLAAFGPDHHRTVEAREFVERIDGA